MFDESLLAKLRIKHHQINISPLVCPKINKGAICEAIWTQNYEKLRNYISEARTSIRIKYDAYHETHTQTNIYVKKTYIGVTQYSFFIHNARLLRKAQLA